MANPIRWMHNGVELELVQEIELSSCNGCYFETRQLECPAKVGGSLFCSEDPTGVLHTDESKIWKEVVMQTKDSFNGTIIEDFEAAKKANPEIGRKYDAGKPMYGLIPADALEEVVKVLTYGAMKYNEPIDQENWRHVPTPQPRYFNAAQRHLWADKRGEEIDSESGLYHLAHAISSLMFKLQLKIEESRKD